MAWLNLPIASKVLMVYFSAPDSSRNYCKDAELLISEYKISVYGKAAWLNLLIASKVLIVYFSAPDSSRNYCKGEELLIAEIQNISNPLNVCLNCLILQVIRTTGTYLYCYSYMSGTPSGNTFQTIPGQKILQSQDSPRTPVTQPFRPDTQPAPVGCPLSSSGIRGLPPTAVFWSLLWSALYPSPLEKTMLLEFTKLVRLIILPL